MDKKEYQKNYKKYHYNKIRKIVTFPLLVDDYELLKLRAESMGISTNKLAKEITINFLENSKNSFISQEQKEILAHYTHISRGIANNINQIAYNTNIGEYIDINILVKQLKYYEDEFKALVKKL